MISIGGQKTWSDRLITVCGSVQSFASIAIKLLERIGRSAVDDKGLFLVILGYALFCVGMYLWGMIFIQMYLHSPQDATSIDFLCF